MADLVLDPLRVERTQVHRAIGVFRYSKALDALGVEGPSRQLTAISRFLETRLGTVDLPPVGSQEALTDWVRSELAVVVRGLDAHVSSGESVAGLALRVQPVVAWNPYEDFAEILNLKCGAQAYSTAARRVRSRGFPFPVDQVCDIAGPFVSTYLPRAVRTFKLTQGAGHEEAWLSTVFYRFALNAAVKARTDQRHLDDLETAAAVEAAPETAPAENEDVLATLKDVLDGLEAIQRQALVLYFGLAGRPQALVDIATTLRTTEHLARATVVRGLATAAARLGIQGVLTAQEFELSRKVFGAGMPVAAAAAEMRIAPRAATRLVNSIGQKFRQGLRVRTTRSVHEARPGPFQERQTMAPTMEAGAASAQILDDLRKLTHTPRIVFDDAGIAYVQLSRQWPVASVRAVACAPSNREVLEQAGDKLDWLATPDVTLERADLDPRYLQLADELRQLGQRTWDVAETLYHQCLDRLGERGQPAPAQPAEDTVARIHRVLLGSARTIEGTLSRELRRRGQLRLRIDWQDDASHAQWENDARELAFDLRSDVVAARCQDLDDLPEPIADVLPNTVAEGIRTGIVSLPGFEIDAETSTTTWLRWQPPVFAERTKSLREATAR